MTAHPSTALTALDPPAGRRARSLIRSFDEAVDRAFMPLRGNRYADWALYAASEAADYSVAWHLIGGGMAAAVPSRRPDAIRLAVALGVESIVVNGVLKRLVPRERPVELPSRTYQVRRPATKSFPSGHASSAMLAAALLTDAAPRLKPLWYGLAATVAASRIHHRMHHASDVVAGATIGTLFGLAVKRIRPLR